MIKVNRAPVLTLWGAAVAERLGFDRDEALTLGRAVAGLNAHSKGVRLGLFAPSAPKAVAERRKKLQHGETVHVELLGRAVPATATPNGLRALSKDEPIAPASVERYLESKVGAALPEVRSAMERLAASRRRERLAEEAFHLDEQFRPTVPAGLKGWGAAGDLDVARIVALIA